ncbi:MAG: hypothetical protein A2452_04985 [Candidatus Firestonebacteria bacterium RIFOXYC2_FULL_39_67]|nr:MAG: hypothetical protein A2536_08940 [Candidatus Firestonebacteria bacterium RIFOXYD2_FULL_39_29]OGF56329.1 MAG: hypothetical protein A2452_04985 [Candidatus Firestonebacteria bacterium RIFOXYC2_FULL_39_67]
MKKRELMGVVSKVLGLYFAVIGLLQFFTMIPMLVKPFDYPNVTLSVYYFIIGIIIAMVVYYLFICWFLVFKTEKISSFLINDSENTDVNIGIGKEGVQQILFFAAGVYLMLDIVFLVNRAVQMIGLTKLTPDLASLALNNIIIALVKVLIGAALIVFCRPISRFVDKLSERFK